jgi:selenocysteine lyase/cysteine desulfurase
VPAAAPDLRAPQFASVHLDLGGREPAEVQRLVWDGYRIEVPVERIGSLTVVRPSVQAYTTDDDCRALVEALSEVLRGAA